MARQPTYAGTWLLLPELCLYEEGDPPESGVYSVEWKDGRADISISWQASDGHSHNISFGGPSDGTRQPTGSDVPSHPSISHVDQYTLDSRAFDRDNEIAYARRTASRDGELLVTVQAGRRPDGTQFHNFQVYKRGGRERNDA